MELPYEQQYHCSQKVLRMHIGYVITTILSTELISEIVIIMITNLWTMTDEPEIQVKYLDRTRRYNITAVVYNSNHTFIRVSPENGTIVNMKREFSDNDIMITNKTYRLNRLNKTLSLLVEFDPKMEQSCQFSGHIYQTKGSGERRDFPFSMYDIRFRGIEIDNLYMNTNYTLGTRALNSHNFPVIWDQFVLTPTCYNITGNDLSLCEPEEVTNVTTDAMIVGDDTYNINISWVPPNLIPNYYIVNISDPNSSNFKSVNVSGNSTAAHLSDVKIVDLEFNIAITGFTAGGPSTAYFDDNLNKLLKGALKASWKTIYIILVIVGPIVCITTGILALFIIFNRRAKLQRNKKRSEYFQDLDTKAPVDPNSPFHIDLKNLMVLRDSINYPLYINDAMEVNSELVKLMEYLGEGTFGVVRKGELLPEGKIVAVKMLKGSPTSEQIREFHSEIEVMKSVGSHPHIVSIVGHCTKNIIEMMLLTEYCSEGNLVEYLRNIWRNISKRASKSSNDTDIDVCLTPSIANQKSPECVFNFNTSIMDKHSLKYKNLHEKNNCDENSFSDYEQDNKHLKYSRNQTNEVLPNENESNPPKNLIVNRLYDECDPENNNEQVNKKNAKNVMCNSSCKCHVQIIPNGNCMENALCANGNDDDQNDIDDKRLTRKCTIKIKDCNCMVNNINNQNNNIDDDSQQYNRENLLIVENYGYDKLNKLETYEENSNIPKNEVDVNDTKLDRINYSEITSTELVSFAKQIASGMEFLSKNKVVHRDLAARNVLVCSKDVVKIADFGLSRDVYQENMYKKSGNGKLPIKWLAIESLTHQEYTSQSDVWSFGILLYEIVTLGSTPYPLIETNRLLSYLKSGLRMERPANCSQELYDLMYSCWNEMPSQRPIFAQITKQIDNLLEQLYSMDHELITMNVMIGNKNTRIINKSTTQTNESYLKPIVIGS